MPQEPEEIFNPDLFKVKKRVSFSLNESIPERELSDSSILNDSKALDKDEGASYRKRHEYIPIPETDPEEYFNADMFKIEERLDDGTARDDNAVKKLLKKINESHRIYTCEKELSVWGDDEQAWKNFELFEKTKELDAACGPSTLQRSRTMSGVKFETLPKKAEKDDKMPKTTCQSVFTSIAEGEKEFKKKEESDEDEMKKN